MWRSLMNKHGFRCYPAAVCISTAVLIPGANGSWVFFAKSNMNLSCIKCVCVEPYQDTFDYMHALSALGL